MCGSLTELAKHNRFSSPSLIVRTLTSATTVICLNKSGGHGCHFTEMMYFLISCTMLTVFMSFPPIDRDAIYGYTTSNIRYEPSIVTLSVPCCDMIRPIFLLSSAFCQRCPSFASCRFEDFDVNSYYSSFLVIFAFSRSFITRIFG